MSNTKTGNYLLLLIILSISACKPVIYSFTADPRVITGNETIRLNWKVNGSASLEYSEHLAGDSTQIRQFRLNVMRGGKQATQTIQVEKIKAFSNLDIGFSTTLLGDTLVAVGDNNAKWSSFEIMSIASALPRTLVVNHEGRIVTISGMHKLSSAFEGTNAAGRWEIKSALLPAEKADLKTAAEILSVKATIKPIKK